MRYIAFVLHLLLIVFCKEEDVLPLIFFIRPNFGLYDGCGFKLFFNITIAICAIKLLFSKEKKKQLKKTPLIMLIILFLYDILLTLLNNISFYFLLTYVTLFLSYIILIIYANDETIDFKRVYLYYAMGMIMSAICGILIPISKFGLEIPEGYRYAALMRDSNGFSLELLFLIISAPVYGKMSKKNPLFFSLLFLFLGLLGISKMFILCVAGILLYKIVFSKKTINREKIDVNKILIFVVAIICLVVLNNKYGFVTKFTDNYVARFLGTEFTSGRNEIANYYIQYLLNDPVSLLFGRSLEYYQIIGYQGWAMVHNTWLELILSFGIVGALFYLLLIYSIIKDNINKIIVFKNELYLLLIVFILCLNALPILSGDALAILILYVILVKNADMEGVENINEKDKSIRNS